MIPITGGDATTSIDKINEARELARVAEQRGITLRFLGGVAIALHCDIAHEPHREFSDLDAVTKRRHVRGLGRVLAERGYVPEVRFNALNADCRLIFYGPEGKLDVFVDAFEMCHRIVLADRLELDSPTLSVVDLLLTKLQVVELNEKDLVDLRLMLTTHDLGSGAGDHVDLDHLRRTLAQDWGLWRTVTGSLDRLEAEAPELAEKLGGLRAAADDGPRSWAFRMRAKIGERKQWFELPEETEGA